MDLQTRKIEFVQEFLKLQSEELVVKFEKLLKKEKGTIHTLTKEQMNHRISQSESDFEDNRFKSSSELISKYS